MLTPAARLPITTLVMLVLTLFAASGCSSACYPSFSGFGGGGSSAPADAAKDSTFSPAAAAGGY